LLAQVLCKIFLILLIIEYRNTVKMSTSELVWGMKNGDLDSVKEIVEKNVS
jgi:hypothetical protein